MVGTRRPGIRSAIILIVLVGVVLGACTEGDTSPPEDLVEIPSLSPEKAFGDELDNLCEPYQRAANAVTLALTRSETATRLDRELDTLEDLREDMRSLEPPASLKSSFESFAKTLTEYINIRHQEMFGPNNLKGAVDHDLRSSFLLRKLWALSKRLDAPDCPPRDIQEVLVAAFTARANRECFDLIKEFRKSDVLSQPATADSARTVLVTLADYQARVAGALARSRPRALHFSPVNRLIDLNQKRATVLRAMVANFDSLDQSAFEANLDRQAKLWSQAKRIADVLGAIVCIDVVPT